MGGQDAIDPQLPREEPATPAPDSEPATPQPRRGTASPGQAAASPGQAASQPGRAGSWPVRRLRSAGSLRLAIISGVAVALTVGLIMTGGTGGSAAHSPRTYGRADNFTLTVLGRPGRHLSLASLAGRPVILNFFASWCAPCQEETPLIARFYRARHGRTAVIGIDVNDQARTAQAFVRKSGVSYPVVVDPLPMKTALSYNLPGLPATFFLNARHQIVKRVFGAVTLPELTAGTVLTNQRGR